MQVDVADPDFLAGIKSYRQLTCTNDPTGNGGDIGPVVHFYREDQTVAIAFCHEVNRDHGLAVAINGAPMLEASHVIAVFDSHVAQGENAKRNPYTGQPWKQGEMQNACDNEDACNAHVITDTLFVCHVDREGVLAYVNVPYHIHKSTRQVVWIDEDRFNEDGSQFHAIREAEEEGVLQGRVPDGMRAAMSSENWESRGSDLPKLLAPLFGLDDTEVVRAHLDCAVVKALSHALPIEVVLVPQNETAAEVIKESFGNDPSAKFATLTAEDFKGPEKD